MAKKEPSHSGSLSKSDEIFEEIFDVALTNEQRKKKTTAPATKTVAKPVGAREKVQVPKKQVVEAPPLRRGSTQRSTRAAETKKAPPKKARAGRPAKILLGLLILAGAWAGAMFLFPEIKVPDLFGPAQKPSRLKLQMPPKPPDARLVHTPPPVSPPQREGQSPATPAEGFLPSVETPEEIAPAKAPQTAKAAEPAKARETMQAIPSASYPYSIYLASFSREDVLRKALENYRAKGLSPYPVRVDLGEKGVWFRVFAGHFESREKAAAFIKEHRLAGAEARNTRFAVFIGAYPSRQAAEDKLRSLLDKGCHPYIIEEHPAGYMIYSGAYFRNEDAEAELARLASKGITGRIAKR